MEEVKEVSDVKRLVVDLPRGLHNEIKTQATWRNITIRKYIIGAVLERIKREEQYK